MKLIHTSDWHIGRRLLQQDLSSFHESFLGWLVELAVREKVDAVLVSGDVYDRSVPSAESMAMLDSAIAAFADAKVPLIMTAGNHDHPVRLTYGGQLFENSRIHVRGSLDDLTRPVILEDEHGSLGVYGITYLRPDVVMEALGAERSHASVLQAACDRIRAHARAEGLSRVVVMAHAFITGGVASDSEQEIKVGGIGDAPATVFDGFQYVALGHLHGPQDVRLEGSDTDLAYSGSPIAFSFSERDHRKSVTIVEIGEKVVTDRRREPVPGLRPLIQVKGTLAELIASASDPTHENSRIGDAFVKAILTDRMRPEDPMKRLRDVWPHTVELAFEPDVDLREDTGIVPINELKDPAEVTRRFFAHVQGYTPELSYNELIDRAAESVREGGMSR